LIITTEWTKKASAGLKTNLKKTYSISIKPEEINPMKKKLCNITGLIVCISLLTLSCDRNRVFEQNIRITGYTWNNKNIIHFDVNIADTVNPHNIYINIRNRSQYKYSNIFMFITTHAPNGEFVRDTFEITLADNRGRWLGKGIGNVWSLQVPYLRNIKFPYRGIYMFDIEQAMWDNELAHIADVGLRVERAVK
jgi:gliding motility-associated lipoprotein GldH